MTNDFVASIFGMPPSNANRLTQDDRLAINAIMDGLGFPSIYKPAEPEPVIVAVPATVEQMHDNGNSIMYGPVATESSAAQEKPTPTAVSMAYDFADLYSVEPATAIRWLVERADEFKTLHAESQK